MSGSNPSRPETYPGSITPTNTMHSSRSPADYDEWPDSWETARTADDLAGTGGSE